MIGQLNFPPPTEKKEIQAVCTSTWMVRKYEPGCGYETGVLWLTALQMDSLVGNETKKYWIKHPSREMWGAPYRMAKTGRAWISPNTFVAVEMAGEVPTGFVRFFDTPEAVALVMATATDDKVETLNKWGFES